MIDKQIIETAEKLYNDLDAAWQSDMEHGVKWLNEKAVEDFKANYPELNVSLSRVFSFLYELANWEHIDD